MSFGFDAVNDALAGRVSLTYLEQPSCFSYVLDGRNQWQSTDGP